MLFIVATNALASQPPERQPTGTPHAHVYLRSVKLIYPYIAINPIKFGPSWPEGEDIFGVLQVIS